MADFDVTRMSCGDFEVMLRQVEALERAVSLALPHMAEGQRTDWKTRAEAAERALRKIMDAYAAYRGRGVAPAPNEYAALVAAIQSAKGILEPTGKAQR